MEISEGPEDPFVISEIDDGLAFCWNITAVKIMGYSLDKCNLIECIPLCFKVTVRTLSVVSRTRPYLL
jgi:hypothetical protein